MSSETSAIPPRLSLALCATLSSLGVLAVVSWTVAPSVTFGDSGELLSAALSLGIAHPPGYPLWCLAIHALNDLGLFATPGCAASMASAFALGVAGLFLFLAFRDAAGSDAAALLATVAYCLMPLVWDYAAVADIYTWDIAFMGLGLWVFQRFYARAREGLPIAAGWAVGLGLALGVGIAHRPTHTVFGLGYLAILCFVPARQWLSPARVAWFLLGLLLALSVWLYLPWRGGAWPHLPGGTCEGVYQFSPVSTFGEFVEQVTCRRYRFLAWGARPPLWGTMLGFDLRILARQWAPLWWPAVAGGLWLAVRRRREAVPLAVVAALGWLLFWNYAVIDPESFLQPFMLGCAGLAAVGLAGLERWGRSLPRRPGRLSLAALWGVLALSVAWYGARTWREVDRSGDLLAQEYAGQALSELGERETDLILGWEYSICTDHRMFPLRYAAWAFDRGWGTWIWAMPQDSDLSWSRLLERLGVDEADRARLMPLAPPDRSRALLRICAARDNVFTSGSCWPREAGGHTEWIGWTSRPVAAPPGRPLDPAVAEPWFAWAEHCLAARPHDRVVRSMAFAPLIELCRDLENRGQGDAAVAILDRAARRDPGNLPVHAAYSELLLRVGEGDRAIEQIEIARRNAECFSDWHDSTVQLGRTLRILGRYEEATVYLERAIQRRADPSLADAGLNLYDRWMLAWCYERSGRSEQAARVLRPTQWSLALLRERIAKDSQAPPAN